MFLLTQQFFYIHILNISGTKTAKPINHTYFVKELNKAFQVHWFFAATSSESFLTF